MDDIITLTNCLPIFSDTVYQNQTQNIFWYKQHLQIIAIQILYLTEEKAIAEQFRLSNVKITSTDNEPFMDK